MYGFDHPLYARHLMMAQAIERESVRQLARGPFVADEQSARRPRARSQASIARWLPPFAALVVGLAVVAALIAVDPSSASQSTRLRLDPTAPTACPLPGHKVPSFAPCFPSAS